MSSHPDNKETSPGWTVAVLSTAAAIGVSAGYCLVLFARPQPWWPGALARLSSLLSHRLVASVEAALQLVGASAESDELRGGAYLLLTACIVPWVVLAVFGRGRPVDIGLRRPNRIGWRLAAVGYVISLPLLLWMVRSPAFNDYYEPQLVRAGAAAFVTYYIVNMLSEHFFFHGVLLGVCRVGHRWPVPPPVAMSESVGIRRALQWLGLAQPAGEARGLGRAIRWVGLPAGCVPAIVTSSTLFGLIHMGKDPRELLLSVPGGVAMAYVAYRTNSWIVPFVLHVATAATALAMMIATNR